MMDKYEGLNVVEERVNGFDTVVVDVLSEERANEIGKKVGRYITITADEPFNELTELYPIGECLARFLHNVLEPHFGGKLCICGLGSSEIAADALGPKVLRRLPLKVFSALPKEAGRFTEICSVAPGTSFTNNMATEAIIAGVVRELKVTCVLLVDSLIAREYSRMSRTIQIATSGGTTPFLSDVKSDWSGVAVPIISLGVPTSIPATILQPESNHDMVLLTSHLVKEVVDFASSIIAYALLRVCYPMMSPGECFIFAQGVMPLRNGAEDSDEDE